MHSAAPLALLVSLSLTTTTGSWLAAQDTQAAAAATRGTSRPTAPAHGTPFAAEQTARIPWRSIGPANMGGRMTDIEVPELAPSTFYIGTAGGGLWKTTNQGVTWEIQFNDKPTNSIGDVAVAPSNPQIVWVGTGEENARNSVSYGDGVYKSTDGGKTFANMGLADSFQIGHIAIHPRDPEIVYVAALGRLWGPNEERGVFRTKDGGKSWQKVLYLNNQTGCMDIRLDPEHPDTVYAVMYDRQRNKYDDNDPSVRFSEHSGMYRSDDGGDKWQKLTGGLPTCKWGRCGISIYKKRPTTLYAVIETERNSWVSGTSQNGDGTQRQRGYLGVTPSQDESAEGTGVALVAVTQGSPAFRAGLRSGDLVTKIGERTLQTSSDFNSAVGRAFVDDKVKFTILRGGAPQELEVTYGTRPSQGGGGPGGGGPGGGGPRGAGGEAAPRLGGQIENIHDTQGEKGYETGGVFKSDDRGETWKRVNSLTERPFYYSVIAVDPSDEQHIYCVGTNLWASHDGGDQFAPTHRGIHVDFHAIWVDPKNGEHILAGCDGGLNVSWDRGRTWEMLRNVATGQFYHVAVDNAQPYNVCGGLQDNGTWYSPSRTRNSEGIAWDDCQSINGGDGFGACFDPEDDDIVFCTSQNAGLSGRNLATGAGLRITKPQGVNRWAWDTPFFLSPHNPRIFYFAGNKACRSLNRGARSEAISDELCLTPQGHATAMAESPMLAGLLWVGTDDGALWRTRDGGKTWTELHKKLPYVRPSYITSIHPSRFRQDRVYLTIDGHRSNDESTYVLVSEDAGDTWTSLADDLPASSPVHICREDPTNENLLFLGTEFSAFVSLDRGHSWQPLGQGLPTVAVRDIAFQNREQELAIATHGRGVWILDIAPLRQLTATVAAARAHLFTPKTVTLWRTTSRGGTLGHKELYFPNPPRGASFYLLLHQKPSEAPVLTVHDITGTQVGTVTAKAVSGLQLVIWDPDARGPAGGGPGGPRGGRGPGAAPGAGSPLKPGAYTVRTKIGDQSFMQPFTVVRDPQDASNSSNPMTSSEVR